MNNIIAATNICSAIFIVVIIIGLYVSIKKLSLKTKYYLVCLWIVLFGLVTNSISYLTEENPKLVILAWITSYLAFASIDFLIVFYVLYLRCLVKEKLKTLSKWFLIYILVVCSIDFVFINVASFTGGLFYIENGILKDGPLASFSSIIPAFCLISILIIVFVRRKRIGFRTSMILTIYIMIDFVAAGCVFINPDFDFSWTATAISMLVIYVMIQSNIIAENRLRAEIYNDLSTKDVLTGLKNRRGYEQVLVDVSKSTSVGVVFCDINSLKIVNDTKGHESGDKLLQRFANICITAFPKDYICRISGDEFVIIVEDADMESFDVKMERFGRELIENDRIASFGYSIGNGSVILDLVKESEQMMYKDKEAYYKETGKKRRI